MSTRFPTIEFERKTIRLAGKMLAAGQLDDFMGKVKAREFINKFRSANGTPLKTVVVNAARSAKDIDSEATVSQRLKRLPSVVSKLQRPDLDLHLDNVQDIAGCRVVLGNIEHVRAFQTRFVPSKLQTLHLDRFTDYIQEPRDSGYRSLHLIYRYDNPLRRPDLSGRWVELQVRSKLQHSWATSVEIAGLFNNQALKQGQGSQDWIHYFKLASKAIAYIELPNLPAKKLFALCQELDEAHRSLRVEATLSKIKVAEKAAKENPNGKFALAVLNTQTMKLDVNYYRRAIDALNALETAEKLYEGDRSVDVFMAELELIHQFRSAYPNYFGDSQLFLETIGKFLKSNRRR